MNSEIESLDVQSVESIELQINTRIPSPKFNSEKRLFYKMKVDTTQPSIELLRLLHILCQTQNLAAAAERMNLTLPTASRMLSRLREDFDDQLFTRYPGGLMPTQKAKLLACRAEDVLKAYDALLKPQQFDPAKIVRDIRIGCADNAPFSVFPNFAQTLLEKAPGILISYLPLSDDRFALLSTGEIDFAVSPVMTLPDGFHALELAESDYVLTASCHHPLAIAAQTGPIETTEVLKYAFADICFHTRPGASWLSLRENVFPAWAQGKVSMRTTQFLALIPTVAESELLMVLPRRTAEALVKNSGITIIPTVEKSVRHKPQLIWHHRANDDLELQWVRSILLDCAKCSCQK